MLDAGNISATNCITRWQGVRMHAQRTMSAMDVLEQEAGYEAREAKDPQSD